MKLTKTACQKVLAEADGAHKWVWDDEVRGFGLRVHPTKRVAYVLKYRVKGQPKARLVTLGWYPDTDLGRARDEARRIKTAASLREDVLADHRAAKEATSPRHQMVTLLDSWRTAQEEALARKLEAGVSVLYERELLRLEKVILRPKLEGKAMGQVSGEFLQALLEVQTSVSTARNLRALIVRFVRHANAQTAIAGLPYRWPTRFDIPRGAKGSREHVYTLEEAARIWLAAGDMGRRGALLRFMLLTGCRRIEAQKIRRDHLVLDDPKHGPHWAQPGVLTKNRKGHRVPLCAEAVALLAWLPKVEGSPLVFPGSRKRKGGLGLIGSWTTIRRTMLQKAGVPDGTLHDFRRTIASTLGDQDVDQIVTDRLLNHAASGTLTGVRAVYQRSEFWAQRVDAIAVWVSLLMAEVTKIRKKPWVFDEPFQEAKLRRPGRSSPSPAAPIQ